MGEQKIKTFRVKRSEISLGHDECKIPMTYLNKPDQEEGISTWSFRRRVKQELKFLELSAY